MISRRFLFILFAALSCALVPAARAQAPDPRTPQGAPEQPSADEQNAKEERRWIKSIEASLIAEKFDDLDAMAATYRREKTRLPGGDWRLRVFYSALDAPQLSDKDSVDHLDHLRKWMQTRPESITARVALATSLHRWAWVARGGGLANTVTPEGWQLFNQRIAESQVVLEGSRDMKTMCPQWYSEMMTVGLAQGWDQHRVEEVFLRAIQFEPDWQYFYTQQANFLLPKWYGQTDDAVKFAKTSADHLGGEAGDMLYFEISTVIIKRGNGNLAPFIKAMDWPRIQQGYKIQVRQAGETRKEQNQLAFMAYHYRDQAVAHAEFVLIGDEWSRGVWKEKANFDRARDWSTGHQSWP